MTNTENSSRVRPSGKTVGALMRRGFDSELARKLSAAGETVSSLKQKSKESLSALGLPDWLVKDLYSESRPPIPEDTMNKVLLESAWSCNICADKSSSIIIHHIEEWADSRSHDESNLIVLCLNHHGEAHTKRELGQNLTPSRLREAKAKWIAEVQAVKANAILRPTDDFFPSELWDYFNHVRLVECAQRVGISPKEGLYYPQLLQSGLIEEDGTPRFPVHDGASKAHYVYDLYGGGRMGLSGAVYRFYRWFIEQMLRRVSWVDLTTNWSRQRINALVRPGTIVVCRGAHIFKNQGDPQACGAHQMRMVRRKKEKIELSFMIDAWESTSSSSHWSHLTRTSSVMSVSIIRAVEQVSGVLKMSATCLGIGTGFGPYLTNDCPYDGVYLDSEEEEKDPYSSLDEI